MYASKYTRSGEGQQGWAEAVPPTLEVRTYAAVAQQGKGTTMKELEVRALQRWRKHIWHGAGTLRSAASSLAGKGAGT